MAYLILFFTNTSPALLDNPTSNLSTIPHYSTISITVILLCNIVTLMWLEQGLLWHNHHQQEKLLSHIAVALESLELCGVVVIGFAIDLSGLAFLQHVTGVSEYTLILLLFLVGIQLRNNGMTLKQIASNRWGMVIAVVVIVSSLVGSLINTFILDLPISTILAMASGFGWYSPSGILLTKPFGPVTESAAFFSDLARELIATMLILGLIRCSHSIVLGLCGATSVDFTLPILRRTGGLDVVPAVAVHGFILSLLVLVLIAFFPA